MARDFSPHTSWHAARQSAEATDGGAAEMRRCMGSVTDGGGVVGRCLMVWVLTSEVRGAQLLVGWHWFWQLVILRRVLVVGFLENFDEKRGRLMQVEDVLQEKIADGAIGDEIDLY